MSAQHQPTAHAGVAGLLASYQPLAGVHDELMDARGMPRAHWLPFLEALAALDADEVPRRFTAADRYLREAGVFHRVYDAAAGSERPWPLSHIPLLIDRTEWQTVSAGLIQRADMLEALLADVYGPQELAREGFLPASLIAGNPEFLRPLVGVEPRGNHYLWFYAADLGRGPDGRWWVLGDRAQAPSGAGYALENRVAISRALADVSRSLNVQRLAGFFQAFRGALSDHKNTQSARVGLLSPGPMNETYFEHAYLARYLGFLLLEGEDLTVRDDKVYVRTVTGLKPIDVLWRRLDADFADPLELNADSRIGVPGLVRAARARNLVVANALGSGFIEARALLGFLPGLARRLTGQNLLLPNVATWWCGQPIARDSVLERIDERVVAPAFVGELSAGAGDGVMLPAELDAEDRARLIAAIRARGLDYVGQEVVHLSTTPVWADGHLEPRPCVVRVFLARTPNGWTVMPGAFCRISDSRDARAVNMQGGSSSADVWVLSDQPAEQTTLLSDSNDQQVRRLPGTLPSRAADNLYWIGRYVERADGLLRLLRGYAIRAADLAPSGDPIRQEIEADLIEYGVIAKDSARFGTASLVAAALSQTHPLNSLSRVIHSAKSAAALIRDRLSPDAWLALRDLEGLLEPETMIGMTEGELIEMTGRALRTVAAFSGMVQENLNRLTGWRFLELGRRIERALVMTRFVKRFARPDAPIGALDALLELADGAISYRQRYNIASARATVVDLLVLDANNPRSVAFQAYRIRSHAVELPGRRHGDQPTDVESLAIRTDALLRTTLVASIDDAFLDGVNRDLRVLSDALTRRYFSDRDVPSTDWD